jgi:hypothetical protein
MRLLIFLIALCVIGSGVADAKVTSVEVGSFIISTNGSNITAEFLGESNIVVHHYTNVGNISVPTRPSDSSSAPS